MTEQRVSPARMLAELLAEATGRSWVDFDFRAQEIVKAISAETEERIEERTPDDNGGLDRWEAENIAEEAAGEAAEQAAEEAVKQALAVHEQRFHAWPERQQVLDELTRLQEVAPHA